MAFITSKIGTGRIWYAVWNDASGKRHRESTGYPVAGNSTMTPAQAKDWAERFADSKERAANGTPVDKVIDAVRAVGACDGMGGRVPTLREFLASIPATTSESSEKNRRRAFKVFIAFLGANADKRIDCITYNQCREFIREQLREVSRKTVTQYHTYIVRAFADAQDIQGLINRNPMRPVSVAQEAKLINPEKGADKQEREAFTPYEIHRLLTEAPEPWRYLVAVSFYLGGLRIGDVCMMRWDSVDMEAGCVSLIEEKTKKQRRQPIIPQLRAVLEKLLATRATGEVYLFPMFAHMFLGGSRATVSTMFTALLQTMGIVPAPSPADKVTGRRKRVSPKSFHSIRHAVVSLARVNTDFTPDMVRDTVGHDSEKVEQGYFHTEMKQRESVLAGIADAISPVSATTSAALAYTA